MYHVAQAERRRFNDLSGGAVWAALPDALHAESARLAAFAAKRELVSGCVLHTFVCEALTVSVSHCYVTQVLFMGAGVSVGAGLPGWGDLLAALGAQVGLKDFSTLPFLDQAKLIARRMGGAEALAAALAERLRAPVHSLVHALLAVLPVAECVTTNYDVRHV